MGIMQCIVCVSIHYLSMNLCPSICPPPAWSCMSIHHRHTHGHSRSPPQHSGIPQLTQIRLLLVCDLSNISVGTHLEGVSSLEGLMYSKRVVGCTSVCRPFAVLDILQLLDTRSRVIEVEDFGKKWRHPR